MPADIKAKKVSLRVGQTKLMCNILFQRKRKKRNNIQYLLIELILQNIMRTNVAKLVDKDFNDFHYDITECRKLQYYWNPWLLF